MIHYSLQCTQSHEFDGWFASSAGFDAQVKRGLVECPVCGDVAITRGLMAPSVAKKGNARQAVAVQPPAQPVGQEIAVAAEHVPAHVRAALQKLRSEVERNCEYVGDAFAEEARRIHEGESEARGIYGETTPEQAEALAEDGIQVARIPWVPRADG
jgi:hypothetical protein